MGNLNVQSFGYQPPYFEAGAYPVAKTVKVASVDIPAHAPVVLDSDGKLALVSTTSSGSNITVVTTGLYGVTPEAIEKDKEGVVYLTGEFFADSLALPANVTAADLEVALRNINIFLK